MAKKKPTGGGKRRRTRRAPEPMPFVPDRRAMEAAMRDLAGDLGGGPESSALREAQDLMYEAFEEPDNRRRAELAKQALAISPDCADAYVLLAEQAPTAKAARELYEKGVAAGERALGPRTFTEEAGRFWGLLETRPYMRAREGLAQTLWTTGEREEAVRHLQEMLRLNPNDNQGNRHTLAAFLLNLDRDDDLAALLDQYPDEGSAAWAYTQALLAFRRQGDTLVARRLLREAVKANKHVPAYLLGEKQPPPEPPAYYSIGDESEALHYLVGFLAGWKNTPGAVAWVRANASRRKKRAAKDAPARGPLAAGKKKLVRLRQEQDVWQVEFRQLPVRVREGGTDYRPWMVLVASRSNQLLLGQDLSEEEPTPERLWDVLTETMHAPIMSEPHRPTEIQVRSDEHWQPLKPHLEELGIALAFSEDFGQVDEFFEGLGEHLGAGTEPGLLDVPGVKPEQVGSFYDAAATFFRQAPWKKVGYESAIKIDCDRFHGGPWYGVLMGQSGLTMGLALYEDLDLLRKMWAGAFADEEESARESVATSVTFGEEMDVPTADLEAIKQYGWTMARPDAYPAVFHKERGLSMRPPLAWELELMEACLRAVPDFVQRHKQGDPAPETATVRTASGELTLSLSWIPENV